MAAQQSTLTGMARLSLLSYTLWRCNLIYIFLLGLTSRNISQIIYCFTYNDAYTAITMNLNSVCIGWWIGYVCILSHQRKLGRAENLV